ncbi:HAD family hydrolase [Roseivivax isoporae]|uniref:Hydrolase n=1 Tax=Roseivivax isoporae LMG 25204 TaxID=1449351 RepID=X7FCK1_9RHOB|nr:HAD family hydrolase [Roseivivax isoporae]ETX29789.1 hydrolase [Roseivivax isoporae LMG 25204]
MAGGAARRLVIFDCDGVLVDSETISVGVFLELLREAGCDMSESEGYRTLLGRSVASISETLAREHGLRLSSEHLAEARARIFARFRTELAPIPGVGAAIRALPDPVCVASSSQPDRIALALGLTGLAPLFGTRLFSASMVTRGKPAPDLFLFAAETMGADPAHCVVIEDSPAGITAAKAAGMRVIGFVGGGHAGPAGLRERVAQCAPDAIIGRMDELAGALAALA